MPKDNNSFSNEQDLESIVDAVLSAPFEDNPQPRGDSGSMDNENLLEDIEIVSDEELEREVTPKEEVVIEEDVVKEPPEKAGDSTEEEPVEEEATEEEVAEEKKEEPEKAKTDEELLMELEEELKAAQERKMKNEESLDAIEEATKDQDISSDEYNKIVQSHNELIKQNEEYSNEISNMQDLVQRYRDKLSEANQRINESEVSGAMSQPIINTVNEDQNLKGLVLSLNKAKNDEQFKDKALDFAYKWLENETGIDIREMISKDMELKKDQISSNDTGNSATTVKRVQKDNGTKDDQMIDEVLTNISM